MDQDTLQVILRAAVRETATEVLQLLLEADREAFLREQGGRKNGYYQRKLETSFGQVELGPGRPVLPQPAPTLRPAPGGRGPLRRRPKSTQGRRGLEPAPGPSVHP